MRIVNPQDAVLTNIEVLSYLTANPPRRPPNPPPNSRHWIPSPDLRDHNTVVKEIHNYATRLSPHLLTYLAYMSPSSSTNANSNTALTPMDEALRALITKLKPFGLTKGEVVMILNLGIGFDGPTADGANGEGMGGEEGQMDVDGVEESGEGQGEGVGEGEEEDEEAAMARDYGALALLDTVIEEREERLSQEEVSSILGIIRETLGRGQMTTSS